MHWAEQAWRAKGWKKWLHCYLLRWGLGHNFSRIRTAGLFWADKQSGFGKLLPLGARSPVSNKCSIAFEADLVAAGAIIAAVPERVFVSPVRGVWPGRNLPSWSLPRIFLALMKQEFWASVGVKQQIYEWYLLMKNINFLKADLHSVILETMASVWQEMVYLPRRPGACFILDCHYLTLGRALSISIKISWSLTLIHKDAGKV